MDLTRLLAPPTLIRVQVDGAWRDAAGSGVQVDAVPGPDGLRVLVAAPAVAVSGVALRWRLDLPEGVRCLGDAWERGYGDLEWRGLVAERTMPWYVLLDHVGVLHGVGVATGGSSFAAWRADPEGMTLELDVRSGGSGVRLGGRTLHAATVRVRPGTAGEDPFAAAHAFCRQLCPAPRLPVAPVYGCNDWYYAYGRTTGDSVRRDAGVLADLARGLAVRPHLVIDAGWYGTGGSPGGPWTPNGRFGDMTVLARDIAAHDLVPGLWVRPLAHDPAGIPEAWRLAGPARDACLDPGQILLDPSEGGVLDLVEGMMRSVTGWGYRLVKHDFSTYDLTGRWGSAMAGGITADGWRLRDDGRTTAEVLVGLYRAIRRGAGDACVLGCNVVGHLAAGLIEVQRTGDDTSGRVWERTRRMGVNTLAMRMPQHGAFFAVDADCVGLTPAIPWASNRQWLDLLARSGTPLFASIDPDALGPEQAEAMRRAFATAAVPRPVSRPLDWQATTQPARWRHADGDAAYRWLDPWGAPGLCPY